MEGSRQLARQGPINHQSRHLFSDLWQTASKFVCQHKMLLLRMLPLSACPTRAASHKPQHTPCRLVYPHEPGHGLHFTADTRASPTDTAKSKPTMMCARS